MENKTKIYLSGSTNPYHNLAVEEYLLGRAGAGECILYLWQNRHTVVIGRNQNAFKECKAEQLAADGGFLARRMSGGGSVFHDLGNLNFTFLVPKPLYDVDRQLSVILRALEDFGLRAEKTGRNDICIEGKKFSGNAFYKDEKACFHHGTLLVGADLSMMSHYLRVSAAKLEANSVESVKSRVVNLQSLCAELTIDKLKAALIRAFGALYAPPETLEDGALDGREIEALTEKYASESWRYGESMEADYSMGQKFPWGEVELLLQIRGREVTEVQLFSDAMEEYISEVVTASLRGAAFEKAALTGALAKAGKSLPAHVHQDILQMIETQEIW